MADVTVTPAQNGGAVTVRAGDAVVVRLPENPTTGYRWQVTAGGTPSGDEFVPGPGGAAGAAGERVLRFMAPASGAMRLELESRRAWEAGQAPQARFAFTVSVR
jgi:inhibitor of cysteine peptidase